MEYLFVFSPNDGKYGVSLRIQLECGKIRTRKTPNADTFHAVNVIIGNLNINSISEKFDQLECLISNHADILV